MSGGGKSGRRLTARQRLSQVGAVILVVLAFVVPSGGIALGYVASLNAAESLVPAAKPFVTEVSLAEFEDSENVELNLTWADGPQLLSPGWAGIITQVAITPGQVLTSGDTVVQVDGVWRLAAHTDQPFYAPVSPESQPAEIQRLNAMLASLSLSAGAGQEWTRDTSRGVQQFSERIGLLSEDPVSVFDPTWVVWLPASSVTLSIVDVRPGMAAPAQGEALAETTAVLVGITPTVKDGVVLPDPGDGTEWVYRLGDSEIAYTGGAQTDTQQIAPLAAPLAASKPETAGAVLLRRMPFVGWEVPTAAVYIDAHENTCVFLADEQSDYAAQTVEIASGAVGVTRVRGELPDQAMLLANPAEVLKDASCGS